MTNTQMRAYFDLVQDKVNEPYFTDAEKNEWLNSAQIDLLNELVGRTDVTMPSLLELDERNLRMLQPLINNTGATSDTLGDIAWPAGAFAILSVNLTGFDTSAKFTRWNDLQRMQGNMYTQADNIEERFLYTYNSTGIKVFPAGRTDWDIVYIAYPSLFGNTNGGGGSEGDVEWPDSVKYKIIAKALAKAGVATEAEMLPVIEDMTS